MALSSRRTESNFQVPQFIDEGWDILETGFNRSLYYLAYGLFKGAGKIAVGLKVTGHENIPKKRGTLASNHRHWSDILTLPLSVSVPRRILWLPPTVLVPRRVDMVARHDLLEKQPQAWFLRRAEIIPVHREGFTRDELRDADSRYEKEHLVGIFPERTRSQNDAVGLFYGGANVFSRRNKAPTTPTAIYGQDHALSGQHTRPIRVMFGEQMEPSSSDRRSSEAWTNELARRVQAQHDQLREEAGD